MGHRCAAHGDLQGVHQQAHAPRLRRALGGHPDQVLADPQLQQPVLGAPAMHPRLQRVEPVVAGLVLQLQGAPVTAQVTSFHDVDLAGEAQHVLPVVADEDHRDHDLVEEPLQVGQDLRLAPGVHGAQRFVQQQQAGAAEQGAGDGHPLLLAAREGGGAAPEQFLQVEERRRLAEPLRGEVEVPLPCPEPQVLLHVEVGKEPGVLEHHPHLPPVGRFEETPRRVLPAAGSHLDVPFGLPLQPGQAAQEGGLAAAGGAVEGHHARLLQQHLQVQRETAAAEVDAGVEAGWFPVLIHGSSAPAGSSSRPAAG